MKLFNLALNMFKKIKMEVYRRKKICVNAYYSHIRVFVFFIKMTIFTKIFEINHVFLNQGT